MAAKRRKTVVGITSYDAYLPRLRLLSIAIFRNMGWFALAFMMVAQGDAPCATGMITS